jgi:hypothetical protein
MSHFTRTTLRRRWLGIPLAIWALLALAGVAFAAWLIIQATANISVTTASFGPFGSVSASTQQGSCTTVLNGGGSQVDVTWSNVMLGGTPCAFRLVVSAPAGSTVGYGKWVAITSAPEVVLEDLSCGQATLPGGNKNYEARLTLGASSQPGTTYGPLSYQLQLAPSPQTCP